MASLDLGTLGVGIEVDDKGAVSKLGGFKKEVEDTGKKSEGLSKKLGSGMKTIGKWGVGLAGAAVAVGGAMFGMAKKSAGALDEIDKLSQKIGLSTDEFQELSYVLSQNGTDITVLQRGFKTMTERMQQSVDGAGKGAEAFELLGVSATDSTGALKSQGDMFDELAKELMKMPEGVEKSTLAFDLFGKAGQELMPMLNGTGEDMDALREKAHDLGLVIDEDTVAAGAELTDTMDDASRAFGAIGTEIGAKVMPIINDLLKWILDHMPQIQETMSTVFEVIGDVIETVVDIFNDYLMPVFQLIFDWVKDNWPQIQETFETVFNAISDLLSAFVDFFQAVWEEWGDVIMTYIEVIWDLISGIFQTAFDLVMDVFNIFKKAFEGDWEGLWEGVKTLFSNIWDNIKKLAKTYIDGVKDIISKVLDKIKKKWDKVWGDIKKFLSETWDNIKETVSTKANEVWQSVKDMAKDMIDALKSLPGDALQIGKDFIRGMIDGIGSMGTALKESVSNMAGNAVKWAKGKLGINSPSKVMHEIGEWTTEGFADGIEDEEDLVRKSINVITDFNDDDFKTPTNPYLSGAGGRSGSKIITNNNSSAPVINLNVGSVRNDGDIKRISRELGKEMTQFNRTLGVV